MKLVLMKVFFDVKRVYGNRTVTIRDSDLFRPAAARCKNVTTLVHARSDAGQSQHHVRHSCWGGGVSAWSVRRGGPAGDRSRTVVIRTSLLESPSSRQLTETSPTEPRSCRGRPRSVQSPQEKTSPPGSHLQDPCLHNPAVVEVERGAAGSSSPCPPVHRSWSQAPLSSRSRRQTLARVASLRR